MEASVSTFDQSDVPGAAPTGTDAIRAERIGDHLLVIRIDRPHRRNAFDGATARAMEAAIDDYEADDTLRCAIVTGSDVAFCSGQDLIAAAHGDMGTSQKRGGFGIMAMPPTKPIIAAVEGHALAGGLELCLSCDLIVSSRTANMGIPEASRSLVAVGGGLFRLPKRIPYHLAMELALTGKPWPATRMAELGLILAAGPLATKASKQIVQRAYDWQDAEGWEKQMAFAGPVMKSEDMAEGLRAFAEKRDPVWKAK
jgi:enoyl-CoA hydratase